MQGRSKAAAAELWTGKVPGSVPSLCARGGIWVQDHEAVAKQSADTRTAQHAALVCLPTTLLQSPLCSMLLAA